MAIAREEGVPVLPRGGGTSQAGQTIRRGAGARLLGASGPHPGDRCREPAGARRAGRRARPAECAAAPGRPHVPGRYLHRQPGHARRHGGQQFLRLALHPLRQHGPQHPCHRGDPGRWQPPPLRARARQSRLRGRHARLYRPRAQGPRHCRARARRHRARLPEGAAQGRRLQSRKRRCRRGTTWPHLLVGSEGTLGFFTAIEVDLQPVPPHKMLGVCHFPRFRDAMDAVPRLVALDPDAVELVDRTIIELGRDIQMFRETVSEVVQGRPDALLLVEFAGGDRAALLRMPGLEALDDAMSDLGHPGAVVRAVDPALQARIWGVREAGLNIVMSMKTEGKPVSFIEDCAVPAGGSGRLHRPADPRVREARHDRHLVCPCLGRPLACAPGAEPETAQGGRPRCAPSPRKPSRWCANTRGSHSGEHGDGIVRSEFHERMFGPALVCAFEEVKDAFDPACLFNPGKIVRAPRMDDRSLFRFKPGYAAAPLAPALELVGLAGRLPRRGRDVQQQRRLPEGRSRRDVPLLPRDRARAGPDAGGAPTRCAWRSPASSARMRSSPTTWRGRWSSASAARAAGANARPGVDMARMKVEFLHRYKARRGLTLRDRLVSSLPHYAPWLAPFAPLLNAAERAGALRALCANEPPASRGTAGCRPGGATASGRWMPGTPPAASGRPCCSPTASTPASSPRTRARPWPCWRPPASMCAIRAGAGGGRPPCCGAKLAGGGPHRPGAGGDAPHGRHAAALCRGRHAHRRPGAVMPCSPSATSFRRCCPGPESARVGERVTMLENLVSEGEAAERLASRLGALPEGRALVHAHCHRKSFDGPAALMAALALVPGARAGACRKLLLRHGGQLRLRGRALRGSR